MKKFVAIACVALCLSVATITLVEAGNIKGPAQGTTICEARGSVVYHETFFGNEMARVAIVGDGSTDLDVFVYDMSGRLVVQGIGLTDVERVTWFPERTQTYRIVVKNLGSTWNRFSMASN